MIKWVGLVIRQRSRLVFTSHYVCESEVKVLAVQSYPTLCDLMNYIAHQAALSVELSRQVYWGG